MNYLFEIGTEEIPARLVAQLASGLRDGILARLDEEGLAPSEGARVYATSRRLAVHLQGLPKSQPDRTEETTGPPAHVAFDEGGAPTKAAEGFARKMGMQPSDLRRVETDKGEYAALTVEIRGKSTQEVLAEAVPSAVHRLYMAVSMRWNRGQGPFVRAVRWMVSLLDAEILPLELFDVSAGRQTWGHRVLGPGPHPLEDGEAYASVLRANGVEPDPEERRRIIREGLAKLARSAGAPEDQEFSEALIQEQVMLNEHPVVLLGEFDERFLSVPREIIDTSMRYHQKMFSLRDADGKLLPKFLTVVNNEDPEGIITRGQRRVLEARLHDADFFWHKDLERKLPSFAEELPRVVFQQKLGSYADKVARLREVLAEAGAALGFGTGDDAAALESSLLLCKADLCSLTVGEFPELQGIVGALLSREEGEPPEVRCPIRFQYAPFDCPREDGTVRFVHGLALLDQLDTLVGCHGVGLKASGSKDPYGLRRAAYVAARILAEGRVARDMDLDSLLAQVRRSFRSIESFQGDEAVQKSLALLESRFRHHMQEELDFPYDEINAVLASGWPRPAAALERLRAVRAVRQAGRLDGLATPLKRISNILRDANKKGYPAREFQQDRAEHEVETELHREQQSLESAVDEAVNEGRYEEALTELTRLRPTVDRFFEEVLVMAEDPEIRAGRLGLLRRVQELFLKIADIGEIVEPGGSN